MALVAELKKNFKKLADERRLSHSYIFFGHESQKDRDIFCEELANYLENKQWQIKERVLSDCSIINAAEDGGIDLVRSIGKFLWQKPIHSFHRTLVISQADRLTVPAQNAILKIAEEPPAHAIIILLLKDPNALLSALQSRFQKIFVSSDRVLNKENEKLAVSFLNSPILKRKEIIKELIEDDGEVEKFITGLIVELAKNKERNWVALREILKRWTLIREFNVNKRLQLEAAFLNI
ncbi:MAG: hypothetical protein HYT03_02915 [Candidatus Harrisonbacteria bacterium]|nr:hypothetical protein [Candidatus Harrisonbacteria bacterium]